MKFDLIFQRIPVQIIKVSELDELKSRLASTEAERDWLKDALRALDVSHGNMMKSRAEAEAERDALREAFQETILQLEYLHEKYQRHASTETVIFRAHRALQENKEGSQ